MYSTAKQPTELPAVAVGQASRFALERLPRNTNAHTARCLDLGTASPIRSRHVPRFFLIEYSKQFEKYSSAETYKNKKNWRGGVGAYNIYTVVITQQRMEFWWA